MSSQDDEKRDDDPLWALKFAAMCFLMTVLSAVGTTWLIQVMTP